MQGSAYDSAQMDDCLFHDPARPFLVASLDMCLARLRARRPIHCRECEAGCHLPRHIPSSRADKLWGMGEPLVCVQPRSDGLVSFYTYLFAQRSSDALGSREAFGMVYRLASEGLVYWSC